jgi:hypothetical protein
VTIGDTVLEVVLATTAPAQSLGGQDAVPGLKTGGGSLNTGSFKVPPLAGGGKEPQPKSSSGGRRNLLLVAGGLLAALLFLFPSNKNQKKAGIATPPATPIIPKIETPKGDERFEKDSRKAAEKFFREGFREFREKNYYRARANFESALRSTPSTSVENLSFQRLQGDQ